MVTHGYLFATIVAMQPMEESFQSYVNNLPDFTSAEMSVVF